MDTRSVLVKAAFAAGGRGGVDAGMRCSASATFLSGNLPMSSDEIASTWSMFSRLIWMARSSDSRKPVTTTSLTEVPVLPAASAASAGAARAAIAKALTEPTRIRPTYIHGSFPLFGARLPRSGPMSPLRYHLALHMGYVRPIGPNDVRLSQNETESKPKMEPIADQ